MNFIPKLLINKNKVWKTSIILPYLRKGETVLDFGCGDLSLASSLLASFPYIKITGVDVVDFSKRPKSIPLRVYDGKRLPFKNKSFDTIISVYVFHHCENPEKSFLECLRVAKKRVLFIESVQTRKFEFILMSAIDWLYNAWKPEKIPLTYQFHPLSYWKHVFKKGKVKKITAQKIQKPFSLMPQIGSEFLFEVYK